MGCTAYLLRPRSTIVKFKVLYIPNGYKANDIGDLLVKNGIIRSQAAFVIWTKISRKDAHLWAGYYNLSPHFSVQFITRILTEHTPYSRLVRVTIPEGYSLRQIAGTLEDHQLVNADDFLRYVQYDAKLDLLAQFPWMMMIPTRNLEGVLYPDTYLFPPSASKRVVVKAMLSAFSRQILPVWNASSSNATLNFYDTLILASMVEKESVMPNEMSTISGVFYNRLKKNMPLASDPTVIYSLGLDWKKTVFYRDLRVDSPYNTYRRRGLPPTPISAPGLSSFKAAIAPESTNFLFFVADKNNSGRHIFSTTYSAHLSAQR